MRRTLRLSIVFLAALLVGSFFANSYTSRLQVITGTVREWRAGDSISVANEQTDPGGLSIALRDTAYDSDPRAIRPGVRVSVWYRNVGERRPVAARVRVR